MAFIVKSILNNKVPNTTIAEFANTVDPDETAHNDLQCLPSSLSWRWLWKLQKLIEPHEKIGLRVSDQVRHKPGCAVTEDG